MVFLALILVVLLGLFLAGVRSIRRGGTLPLAGGVLLVVASAGASAWLIANWSS